eukprot:COSAG02_NODE_2465_length_8785_cov_21.743610_11_plen_90_part_00
MLVTVFLAAYAAGPDMGPTFGADYAGGDYNVTSWNTPKSGAANNYKASALACEAYCNADPKCCAWTCEFSAASQPAGLLRLQVYAAPFR